MKTLICFSLLVLVFGFAGFSQDPNSPDQKRTPSENRGFKDLIALQSPGLKFQAPDRKDLQPGNRVFIEQIGVGNTIEANTSAESSDLKLYQYGNQNYIGFMGDAKNLEGTLVQKGNNNASFDFSLDPDQDSSADLVQQGDKLHFESYGSNSIGNGLKFIQTGDTKSVLVRNFQ